MIGYINETKESEGLESWEGFIGTNFLKAESVASEDDTFICIDVSLFTDTRDDSKRPRLTLEKGKDRFFFDLNVTNSNFLKDAGISTPKSLVGKQIFFKKVLVVSPKTKKEVESLRICQVI